MGHGKAKSTGIGVIKWTFKAILCSTALIALVIAYSILGAFLFRAVENNFSIQNAHLSQRNRQEYLANVRKVVDDLCQRILAEKRKQYAQTTNDNEDNLATTPTNNNNNTTAGALYSATNDTWSWLNETDTNSTTTTTTTTPPTTSTTRMRTTTLPNENITLPDMCTNVSQTLDARLRIYEGNLTIHRGWRFDFRDNNLDRQKWTLAEGLLFSVTVMTTIGYGNLVPKTFLGRVATMVYAMLGIPLMLLCLAYIGNIWANVLRLIYTAFYRCCQKCRRANQRKTGKMDVTSRKGSAKHDNTNGSIDPEIAAQTEQEDEEIPVPAWLAFLILVTYIAGGSVLFSEWEGWEYKDSIYFCFITFSTIGFGDLVPGDSISESDPERAATCAIYILFGLATMSMVISVIQEDVIRVVYKLGNKIGLTKNKKPSG